MFPVDAFRATLSKAATLFERHSIHLHLTGGITSVVYGKPRMTQDIDIVIDNQAVASAIDAFLTHRYAWRTQRENAVVVAGDVEIHQILARRGHEKIPLRSAERGRCVF